MPCHSIAYLATKSAGSSASALPAAGVSAAAKTASHVRALRSIARSLRGKFMELLHQGLIKGPAVQPPALPAQDDSALGEPADHLRIDDVLGGVHTLGKALCGVPW